MAYIHKRNSEMFFLGEKGYFKIMTKSFWTWEILIANDLIYDVLKYLQSRLVVQAIVMLRKPLFWIMPVH